MVAYKLDRSRPVGSRRHDTGTYHDDALIEQLLAAVDRDVPGSDAEDAATIVGVVLDELDAAGALQYPWHHTDQDDPQALSRWDRLVVRVRIWWWSAWHRYCTACDEIHRPWDRSHRSCHCGISRPDTWTPEERDAFRTVIEAASQAHGEGEPS